MKLVSTGRIANIARKIQTDLFFSWRYVTCMVNGNCSLCSVVTLGNIRALESFICKYWREKNGDIYGDRYIKYGVALWNTWTNMLQLKTRTLLYCFRLDYCNLLYVCFVWFQWIQLKYIYHAARIIVFPLISYILTSFLPRRISIMRLVDIYHYSDMRCSGL